MKKTGPISWTDAAVRQAKRSFATISDGNNIFIIEDNVSAQFHKIHWVRDKYRLKRRECVGSENNCTYCQEGDRPSERYQMTVRQYDPKTKMWCGPMCLEVGKMIYESIAELMQQNKHPVAGSDWCVNIKRVRPLGGSVFPRHEVKPISVSKADKLGEVNRPNYISRNEPSSADDRNAASVQLEPEVKVIDDTEGVITFEFDNLE
jgi:hypothetical protein